MAKFHGVIALDENGQPFYDNYGNTMLFFDSADARLAIPTLTKVVRVVTGKVPRQKVVKKDTTSKS